LIIPLFISDIFQDKSLHAKVSINFDDIRLTLSSVIILFAYLNNYFTGNMNGYELDKSLSNHKNKSINILFALFSHGSPNF
jgi:hypothetical protein